MKQKTQLSRYIQIWGTVFIVGVAVCITAVDVARSYKDFYGRSAQLRDDYITNQKANIKQEVERVAQLISYQKSQTELVTRQMIRLRTYEAFSIAQHIFEQNKLSYRKDEIHGMIVDALRPVRYADDSGYYFVTGLDGVEILFADKPEIEGRNLLGVRDVKGKYVVKDIIQIAKTYGEGFCEYYWTKPKSQGGNFKKISFVKLFKPYQWVIGTGLYVNDIEEQIQADLLSTISRIRFGKEGYIFVNKLNGDALVSNGKVFSGTEKLWEVFAANPEKMKNIFQKEYDAAMQPGGDYIYYSHVKLTSSEKETPKASYILGIPEWGWLIGAGFYLDDVEKDIAGMQVALKTEITRKILFSLLISMGVFSLFLFFFHRLSKNLKNDTDVLVSFFQKASFSHEKIDRELVHFEELDRMAESVNIMLEDRDTAEKALQKSEQRFKDLAENSTDWIWEFDENERFTYVSPRVKNLLGYSPEELLGQSAFEPMTSKEAEKVFKKFILYKELREPFANLVNENLHKDGRKVILESSGIPVFDRNGDFRGYRGIDRDITERIEIEEQLRQAHKMEAVGTLAGGIAHDFNNILTAIIGYAELAQIESPQSAEMTECIDEILKASKRAKELVRHILSFSRKEPGKQIPVQIDQIVTEVIQLLRATIPASIEICTEIDAGCGQILADPTQVHQIVLNLCTNACQAIDGPNGRLQVKLSRLDLPENILITTPERVELPGGSYVVLTVSDNGPGIEGNVIHKIFDPYFTTKDAGKGSGMGLAMVHGFVKSFNGVIEVESTVGIGSHFHVYFPYLDSDTQIGVQDKVQHLEKATGKERVLVVDDEREIVALTQKKLELLGYTVTVCTQAQQAIDLFYSKPDAFDLVITDQSMPKMTGEQLVRKILEIRSDIPIIMCTGYSAEMDAEKAAMMGIQTFLMKPVDYAELARSVRDALDAE
ncbi:cache domain-containing protein [Desulfogranum japonicum]|uniref:cache domain-containing protein n=1 Tax=Desulfogranum japonicum TaxID=231447 RepID=UPI0003F7457D|nr:cache domain-containing protein [Desulfogranum japonicum]